MRDPKHLNDTTTSSTSTVSAATNNAQQAADQVQGVFVVSKTNGKERVHFVPVTTGITGATDIEVTSGLKSGDRILRDLKENSLVKQDTTLAAPQKDSSSSS